MLISMKDEEMPRQFFYISIFMICAAIIDLGIDRVLLGLADSGYIVVYKCVSVAEFFLGSMSTILAGYSLDRFFVLIQIKSRDLVGLDA